MAILFKEKIEKKQNRIKEFGIIGLCMLVFVFEYLPSMGFV